MRIRKAVITAAGPAQRTLPLQTLIDRDGAEKSVLAILVEEALRAKIEEICVVVWPGDEAEYARVAGDHSGRIAFVHQPAPRGYADAVACAREFTSNEPFLHMVSDHLFVNRGVKCCAESLVEIAEEQDCAVSAVQATREHLLGRFGAVAGPRVQGRAGIYRIETVIEKPTPTEAEQRLVAPGLRAGHYLCFFGLHVLTPGLMEILAEITRNGESRLPLSPALAELARRERYLALELPGRRYDLGARYGFLTAQIALALEGTDRYEVLSQITELLATREMEPPER